MRTKAEKKIIEIGKTENIIVYQDDGDLKNFMFSDERCGSQRFNPDWVKDWSPADVKIFFKGLVLCEKFFEWHGGSGAINIFVFQYLREILSNQEEIDLLNWAFKNRGSNPYTPTGFRRHDWCESYDDMLKQDKRTVRQYEQHDLNMKKQQESKKEKEIIMQEQHSERQKKYKAHSEELKEEMRSFCLKNIKKKTEIIKNDELTFPINMLPDEEIDLFYHHVVFSKDERKRFLRTLPRNKGTSQRIRQLKVDIRTEKKEKANLAYKHKVRTERIDNIRGFFLIIISYIPILIILYLVLHSSGK